MCLGYRPSILTRACTRLQQANCFRCEHPDVKEYCKLFILYLLSGPFKVNGCPLRRVNQRFVVATSTSIDLSGVKVPEKIDDAYFRRARKEKKGAAKKEGDIFEAKKESYKVGLYYSTEISIRKLTC